MPVINEGRYASDWLKEYEHDYSVEEVIVAAGSGKLDSGMVVGKITASGKYQPVTVAAADGSQNAAGILMNPVDATAADVPAVVVVRKAKVVQQGLLYGADVGTAAERLAVHNALRALNPPILVREGA